MKKRREAGGASAAAAAVAAGGAGAVGAAGGDATDSLIDSNVRGTDPAVLERLPEMVQGVMSANGAEQMQYTLEFRKLLSIGTFRASWREGGVVRGCCSRPTRRPVLTHMPRASAAHLSS